MGGLVGGAAVLLGLGDSLLKAGQDRVGRLKLRKVGRERTHAGTANPLAHGAIGEHRDRSVFVLRAVYGCVAHVAVVSGLVERERGRAHGDREEQLTDPPHGSAALLAVARNDLLRAECRVLIGGHGFFVPRFGLAVRDVFPSHRFISSAALGAAVLVTLVPLVDSPTERSVATFRNSVVN